MSAARYPTAGGAVAPHPLGPFRSFRRYLRYFVGYELLILGWAVGTTAYFLLIGDPLFVPKSPPGGLADFEDGLWHLGTTALLALPTRRPKLIAGAALLSLGFDADHLPGYFGFAVVARPDHNLVFFVVAAGVMFAWQGAAGGFAAAGAILSHIGLDGGKFPLASPLTPHLFGLTFATQVLFIAIGGLLIFLAARSPRELLRPRTAGSMAGVVAVLAATVFFVWPVLGIFANS